jgi:hypothetical protein
MLSAYCRALKPGGRLLLEQINRDSLIGRYQPEARGSWR